MVIRTRRMLAIGTAVAALAVAGCGENDEVPAPTEAAAQGPVKPPRAAPNTPKNETHGVSDAAQQCGSSLANRCNSAVDVSKQDKTLYFSGRSDTTTP